MLYNVIEYNTHNMTFMRFCERLRSWSWSDSFPPSPKRFCGRPPRRAAPASVQKARAWARKTVNTSRFVRVILAQGPC